MSNPLDIQVGGGHYKKYKIQPIEYVHANNIPFIEGSIIKYATRWRDKGGVNDLEKIKHLVDLLIKLEKDKEFNQKIYPAQGEVKECKKNRLAEVFPPMREGERWVMPGTVYWQDKFTRLGQPLVISPTNEPTPGG